MNSVASDRIEGYTHGIDAIKASSGIAGCHWNKRPMEKQDEPQVDGKRGGSHGPYVAGTKYWRQVQMNLYTYGKIYLQASLNNII